MDILLSVLVAAAAFYLGGLLLKGVKLTSFVQCIVVAVVVAFLDLTLGSFLKIVTLGLLSLGIFSWLLNAILILVADWFLKGFYVKNFWWALGLAAIVSIATNVMRGFIL